MSNERAYTEWQVQVSQQLSVISQKLDSFKEWQDKHDIARFKLIERVESLEHSRTWMNGSLYTLWLLVGTGVATLWKRLVG